MQRADGSLAYAIAQQRDTFIGQLLHCTKKSVSLSKIPLSKALFSVTLALAIALAGGCATVPPAPDAPRLENFKFTPATFSKGQPVELSFDYRNIRGGLLRSKVSLDYEGTLPHHRRNPSLWSAAILGQGGKEENGTFRSPIPLTPTDPPPFDIWYYLQITDGEGRRSNVVSARVSYR